MSEAKYKRKRRTAEIALENEEQADEEEPEVDKQAEDDAENHTSLHS